MKITDLAIIFILITIPFLLMTTIKREYLNHASEQSVLYNRILDTAVQDAASVYATDESFDKDRVKDTFFKTLKVNFELPDTHGSTQILSKYIPAMVSIEKDGFAVLAQSEYINNQGYKERRLIWQPKIPYSYALDNYIYRFYLDDHLEIYTKNMSHLYKGSYELLKGNEALSDSILPNEEIYKGIKTKTIISKIERELNHHVNAYNSFSRNFGIVYEFFLPSITKDDWENSISDVSLLVFFQGLPIGSQENYYNNYAIGGSRIVKSKVYYVSKNLLIQRKEYHNETCERIDINGHISFEVFRTKFDAAKSGAFPCPECQ